MNNKQQEREHWRKNIADAERILGHANRTMHFRRKRRIEIFIEKTRMREGKQILEIGCGAGHFTEGLAKSGAKITAVDLSPELLELAKTRSFSNVEYRLVDIEDMPFTDGSFDAVVGNSILHHCDISIALPEIHRVLRKGAAAVFSEPNMLNPHIFLQKNIGFLKRLAGDTPGETAFFRWKLKDAFRRAGFSSVEVRPFDFLYPLTPAPLIAAVSRIGGIAENIPVVREMAGSLMVYARAGKDGNND